MFDTSIMYKLFILSFNHILIYNLKYLFFIIIIFKVFFLDRIFKVIYIGLIDKIKILTLKLNSSIYIFLL